jgi:hypothetical protein
MDILGYYDKSLILIKENPTIIILMVLLVGLNLIVIQGIFYGVLSHMETFSYLGYLRIFSLILLVLADIFIYTAIVGMTRKVLLNEIVTLKTGWKIGKKHILKILMLNITIGIIIVFVTLLLGIILTLTLTALYYPTIPHEIIFVANISLVVSICIIICFLSLFASQAIILGEKGIIEAIKQSVQLVLNNKVKAIIILTPLILNILMGFIPIIGQILNSIIGPILGIYLTILITLVYIDLTQVKTWKIW